MTTFKFSDVDKWARKSEVRMTALFHESTQELTQRILKPEDEGGRFPVDTSFLRNSISAAVNSLPTGETEPPEEFTEREPDFAALALVINRAKLGDTVTLGFTAKYAPYMEARYGMVRSETVNWQQIVRESAAKLKG